MYAGEPYITTPEGFIMPMETASHLYNFQAIDPRYAHHPYPLMAPHHNLPHHHPQLHHQYSATCDEGFVSVDQTTNATAASDGDTSVTTDEGKFGKLRDKERQQIQHVLHETQKTKGKGEEVNSADLSDSGVSETEEVAATASNTSPVGSASIESKEILQKSSEKISNSLKDSDITKMENYSENKKCVSTETSHTDTEIECKIQQKCDSCDRLGNKVNSDGSISSAETVMENVPSLTHQSVENTIERSYELQTKSKKDLDSNKEEAEITETKEDILECNLSLTEFKNASSKHEIITTEDSSLSASTTSNCRVDSIDSDTLSVQIKNEVKNENTIESSKSSTADRHSDENVSPDCEEESSKSKDLGVTEAVRRWIREVTPDKAFSLSDEVQSMLLESSIDEFSDEDDYFEDQVVHPGEKGGGTCLTNASGYFNKGHDIELQSKNVKGNPFGAPCSDSKNQTKRVASCSTSDILDDYDGCSSISSLSDGQIFSPNNQSQSSSRTITPSRHFNDCHVDEQRLHSLTCDPSGFRKYYQLGIEIDDASSPQAQQSPPSDALSNGISTNNVLPLAAEILTADQYSLTSQGKACKCSVNQHPPPPNCGSPSPFKNPPKYGGEEDQEDASPTSPTSSYSSGIGSSLASTPVNSPQRSVNTCLHARGAAPQHSGRLPFLLLPPNMQAENSAAASASLNAIHCCSLM